VQEFQTNLLLNMRNNHQKDVLDILKTGVINDDVTKILEAVATDLAKGYKK
jgi:F-type H+-transporting ATPase subunit alpha